MRILGIDPGLAIVGLGVIDTDEKGGMQAVEWLTIKTNAGLPLSERIVEIAKDLKEYIDVMKPDLAVVEKLFFATNAKTGIDVAHARGVIVLTLAQCGVEAPAASVNTGRGRPAGVAASAPLNPGEPGTRNSGFLLMAFSGNPPGREQLASK